MDMDLDDLPDHAIFSHVSSSWIEASIYDPVHRDLTITFLRGGSYTYHDIHPDIHELFLSAPSQGKFVNMILKKLD